MPRVQSINASGHKFGLVPPGLGWVVFRDRKVFNEDLVFYVNYLGGESPTATLNFSKGSAHDAGAVLACSCAWAAKATRASCSTRSRTPCTCAIGWSDAASSRS